MSVNTRATEHRETSPSDSEKLGDLTGTVTGLQQPIEDTTATMRELSDCLANFSDCMAAFETTGDRLKQAQRELTKAETPQQYGAADD